MAQVAIAEITTPEGNRAIAIEIATNGDQLTIALEGSVINDDPLLIAKVNDIIKYVKEHYNGE